MGALKFIDFSVLRYSISMVPVKIPSCRIPGSFSSYPCWICTLEYRMINSAQPGFSDPLWRTDLSRKHEIKKTRKNLLATDPHRLTQTFCPSDPSTSSGLSARSDKSSHRFARKEGAGITRIPLMLRLYPASTSSGKVVSVQENR